MTTATFGKMNYCVLSCQDGKIQGLRGVKYAQYNQMKRNYFYFRYQGLLTSNKLHYDTFPLIAKVNFGYELNFFQFHIE